MNNPYPPAKGNWRKLLPGEKRVTPSGLPIAPAFTDVYISKDKASELEAVAKDSKNRTIYIHSKKHKSKAGVGKFKRIDKWEAAYPLIMARVIKHFPRKEEAKVIYLIDKTKFRVGGEGDTKASIQAYGATTLKSEHIKVDKDLVRFNFIGKKGVQITKVVEDPMLARLIRSRLSKERIFETTEGHVLSYFRSLPKAKSFKVSDIRPYYGTKIARQMIKEMPIPSTKKEFVQARKKIATVVSEELSNTPGIALSSYIDPKVWSIWETHLPPTTKKTKKHKKIKK